MSGTLSALSAPTDSRSTFAQDAAEAGRAVGRAEKPEEKRPDAIVWFAGLVALIPTTVSGWGMFGVFQAMGMPMFVSAGTSFFLEGLLVTLALLARRAIQNARSAKVEMLWAWIVSAISGSLSAAHDFVGPGGHMIEPTLMTYISACVRIVAPLAAALMWHRVLVADELDASPMPPRSERRARDAVFQAACAAQDVSVATNEKDRALAEERFRKAWRLAITRSMMHWTPQELTAAGRAWAHVLVVGDDLAGTAVPGALERTDPQALAAARRMPRPEEWMGEADPEDVNGDSREDTSADRAAARTGSSRLGPGSSSQQTGASRPTARMPHIGESGAPASDDDARPEEAVLLDAEPVDEQPALPTSTGEADREDDTMVILVPRVVARAEEDAEAEEAARRMAATKENLAQPDAEESSTEGTDAPADAEKSGPLRPEPLRPEVPVGTDAKAQDAPEAGAAPDGASAPEVEPAPEDSEDEQLTSEDVRAGQAIASDATAAEQPGAEQAAADRREESLADLRFRLAEDVLSSGGNANDLAQMLADSGQPVPSMRTCRRLLSQARARQAR